MDAAILIPLILGNLLAGFWQMIATEAPHKYSNRAMVLSVVATVLSLGSMFALFLLGANPPVLGAFLGGAVAFGLLSFILGMLASSSEA